MTLADLEGIDPERIPPSEVLRAPAVDHRLVVQRLVFDRESPWLRLAVTMADEGAIEPVQRALWRANGFGIGQVPRERLALFMANMPPPRGVDVYRMHNASTYAPLTLLRRAGGGDRIRLVAGEGDSSILEPGAGEYRMLVKLTPSAEDGGSVRLDLAPDHQRGSRELLPRSPEDRLREGAGLGGLRLEQAVEPGMVWVIWADLPPLPEEGGDQEQEESVGEPASPATEAEGELSLAEAMLSGERRGRAVQILILLSVR